MLNESGCIAVVDDDPIMGESLQRALELEGWRAVWWHTGKKAVDGMFELRPDLVLCDIRLPDMNGEEVFRATNARSLAPPFIFMTAFGRDRSGGCARSRRRARLSDQAFRAGEPFSEGARSPVVARARCRARRPWRVAVDAQGSKRCFDGWRPGRCRFSSPGKQEPERRSARGFCTRFRRARRSRSWR